MLYRMKLTETTAVPRIVHVRSLSHLQAPASTLACDAADSVDGRTVLQPTIPFAAMAWKRISPSSVSAALRLTPEQRDEVRHMRRPLVLPRSPKKLPAPVIPLATPPMLLTSVEDARRQLDAIVEFLGGIDATLSLLAVTEEKAAA